MRFRSTIISIAILLAASFSCMNEDKAFYRWPLRGDLSRIPLIKPYELLNQAYADSNYFGTHGWNLGFRYNVFQGYISHVNVSHVNVIRKVIFGHGKDGKTGFPNYWFVVIPSEKIEKIFENENEWRSYINSKNINPDEILSAWSVYDGFYENHTLPWYDPSKKIYP